MTDKPTRTTTEIFELMMRYLDDLQTQIDMAITLVKLKIENEKRRIQSPPLRRRPITRSC